MIKPLCIVADAALSSENIETESHMQPVVGVQNMNLAR